MTTTAPTADLDERFSSAGASARPWAEVEAVLAGAGAYWLSTVRSGGRPHVTPLIGVWAGGTFHFCTGADEQKARNLDANPYCAVTTGRNDWDEGLDVVVEGTATRVNDEDRLRALADAWVAKYGDAWRFEVRDGAFHHEGGPALVFAVAPSTVFAFGKGEPYSQARYRFGQA